MRAVILAAICVCLATAKEPTLEWKDATVIFVKRQIESSTVGQSMRQEMDIVAGDATYTVEEWILPNGQLRLEQGDKVQFALRGKAAMLKYGNSKPRKLKVVATYPKRSNAPKR